MLVLPQSLCGLELILAIYGDILKNMIEILINYQYNRICIDILEFLFAFYFLLN